MATIVFFQKPGCATNARQSRALKARGHSVKTMDLLREPWTAERLRGFFGKTPVASWFNRAAPRVKSGEIDPDRSDAATALALMLADPLLIRRPLIEADGARCAGFDCELVLSLLGTGADQPLEGCSREGTRTQCPSA